MIDFDVDVVVDVDVDFDVGLVWLALISCYVVFGFDVRFDVTWCVMIWFEFDVGLI